MYRKPLKAPLSNSSQTWQALWTPHYCPYCYIEATSGVREYSISLCIEPKSMVSTAEELVKKEIKIISWGWTLLQILILQTDVELIKDITNHLQTKAHGRVGRVLHTHLYPCPHIHSCKFSCNVLGITNWSACLWTLCGKQRKSTQTQWKQVNSTQDPKNVWIQNLVAVRWQFYPSWAAPKKTVWSLHCVHQQ